MANHIDERADTFADLEYRMSNPKAPPQDVVNRNAGINIMSK
ncbi:unnamed protein product, partial [Adineta ricciae]